MLALSPGEEVACPHILCHMLSQSQRLRRDCLGNLHEIPAIQQTASAQSPLRCRPDNPNHHHLCCQRSSGQTHRQRSPHRPQTIHDIRYNQETQDPLPIPLSKYLTADIESLTGEQRVDISRAVWHTKARITVMTFTTKSGSVGSLTPARHADSKPQV